MGYWSTRGLRGSAFEQLIDMTNDLYREKGLALVQKVPTPITPMKLDAETSTITLAYFEKKSTVDFIGVAQGIPICFDAKDTRRTSFPLQNIHAHQMDFMAEFERQKGIAFLLVRFVEKREIFYLPYTQLKPFWEKAQTGGRKSIPYDAFDRDLLVESKNEQFIHYLEAINVILKRLGE